MDRRDRWTETVQRRVEADRAATDLAAQTDAGRVHWVVRLVWAAITGAAVVGLVLISASLGARAAADLLTGTAAPIALSTTTVLGLVAIGALASTGRTAHRLRAVPVRVARQDRRAHGGWYS